MSSPGTIGTVKFYKANVLVVTAEEALDLVQEVAHHSRRSTTSNGATYSAPRRGTGGRRLDGECTALHVKPGHNKNSESLQSECPNVLVTAEEALDLIQEVTHHSRRSTTSNGATYSAPRRATGGRRLNGECTALEVF